MKRNMIPSLIISNLPEPSSNSNPNNSFIGLVKLLIEKANFTRGQVFYLILTGIYMSFIIITTASPTIVSVVVAIRGGNLSEIRPPIPVKDLMLGLKIWFSLGVVYFFIYAIPELRDRWKTNKKTNT